MKVRCVSIRDKMPEQIRLGEIYYINPKTIWMIEKIGIVKYTEIQNLPTELET